MKSDFSVKNCGTVFMVYPKTKKARTWVDENVPLESWQWLGNGFCVDQHCIENLVLGMERDGLKMAS